MVPLSYSLNISILNFEVEPICLTYICNERHTRGFPLPEACQLRDWTQVYSLWKWFSSFAKSLVLSTQYHYKWRRLHRRDHSQCEGDSNLWLPLGFCNHPASLFHCFCHLSSKLRISRWRKWWRLVAWDIWCIDWHNRCWWGHPLMILWQCLRCNSPYSHLKVNDRST